MRILYATDGSEGGLSPARFLAGLPHHRDVHVHLVTVREADDPDDGADALAAAEAALGEFPGHVTTATARVNSGATGEVTEVILYTADYVGADLIAVGASGHSAIAKFFLGSVAESVARHSRHPVLVTRPQTAPLREVIVGVDGSDSAAAAAAFTVSRLPLPLICTLRLASVVPQPVFSAVTNPLYPGMPDYLALEMVNEEARKKAGLDVEALADTLRRAKGGCRIEGEPVTLGSPAAELVRIADEHSAGLIVVGSQGLSGITRFLLGSVSERVLRHAHCSVLIVK